MNVCVAVNEAMTACLAYRHCHSPFRAAVQVTSAGELGFRDFSSLSSVKENRRQLRDSAYAFQARARRGRDDRNMQL
jgi:hypothetical protein